jgi:hypothetical protein
MCPVFTQQGGLFLDLPYLWVCQDGCPSAMACLICRTFSSLFWFDWMSGWLVTCMAAVS